MRFMLKAAPLLLAPLLLTGCASESRVASESYFAPPPPEAVSQPAKAATAPQTLLKDAGQGLKTTQPFTAGGAWDLHYTYDCSDMAGDAAAMKALFEETGQPVPSGLDEGLMSVWLLNEQGDEVGVAVNELGVGGDAVTHQAAGGTFSLKVNATCDWTVEVRG